MSGVHHTRTHASTPTGEPYDTHLAPPQYAAVQLRLAAAQTAHQYVSLELALAEVRFAYALVRRETNSAY